MSIRKPTARQIRAYRNEKECSLAEARAVIWKQWRSDNLEALRIQNEILDRHNL